MTIRNTYAAESWDKIYSAFEQVNFTSYDYDTVKESLLQYLKTYHAEHYNDFIESSELIAILELFAYITELLAYRIDTMSHENFISTAQRKQSILRLAKLISYKSSRNIPARGLVKITSIRTTEEVYDSLGNNLANTTIIWNDANNSNWKEQFFLVMNKVLTNKFGIPSKSFQVNNVTMQQYTFNNNLNSFRNGVFAFSATSSAEQIAMELVPADLDENGPYERSPDLNSQFNILFLNDGNGDGSDYTGFQMFTKQGTLVRTDYSILEPISNRRVELDLQNINDIDIWVYRVDDNDSIIENWHKVETLNEQNLQFNDNTTIRKKFEVESLENDKIALLFGDGNLSDAPIGNFQLWTRVSANADLNIPKNRIVNESMGFIYTNIFNNSHECYITFSLASAIQNSAISETIEHIRQTAPSTYYAQNRMVNGQDYNTYMLRDTSILRLKAINRTFAGQSKYLEWNDASQKYQNIKLFGDDLSMHLDTGFLWQESQKSGKALIDEVLEPMLSTNGMIMALTHILSSAEDSDGILSIPRKKFIEDNRTIYYDDIATMKPVDPYGINYSTLANATLKEKSAIQSAIDGHWYGDPIGYTTIANERYAIVKLDDKDDGLIYQDNIKRITDLALSQMEFGNGVLSLPESGLQGAPTYSFFGLKFNRFCASKGNGDIYLLDPDDSREGCFASSDSYDSSTNSCGIDYQPFWDKGYETNKNCPAKGIDTYRDRKEVLTVEMTSDGNTFTVTSNLRGKLPNYSLVPGTRWSLQTDDNIPADFIINNGSIAFEEGDAFIIDVFWKRLDISVPSWVSTVRNIKNSFCVNLNGWWQIIPQDKIPNLSNGPSEIQALDFDPEGTDYSSWLFLIKKKQSGWDIWSRNLKIIAESPTTKFWYNQESQIIDNETKKPVFDKIRILKSNLDEFKKPLKAAQLYDVVGNVYSSSGEVELNKLEVIPTGYDSASNINGIGDLRSLTQFENFSSNAYEFFIFQLIPNTSNYKIVRYLKDCDEYSYAGYDYSSYENESYSAGSVYVLNGLGAGKYDFINKNYISELLIDTSNSLPEFRLGRRIKVPALKMPFSAECYIDAGLDFMWQHFTSINSLVDPSISNIHDIFVLPRGYYNSVMMYAKGATTEMPQKPTPLDLRTSYGYLLRNKMLSDTVVLHAGKIKLLFGDKADQQFRAKFKVVKTPAASFSDERIKMEIISVIDTFFDINNWDFGDKFYATELISLIHQRLTSQIASVVIVPMYSINYFGSLFTIDSSYDEVLQSCATVNDIEIVQDLTPSNIRQVR